jgi:hypothetical protein
MNNFVILINIFRMKTNEYNYLYYILNFKKKYYLYEE